MELGLIRRAIVMKMVAVLYYSDNSNHEGPENMDQ